MTIERFTPRSACRKCGLEDEHKVTWESSFYGMLQVSWNGRGQPTKENLVLSVVRLVTSIPRIPNDEAVIAHLWEHDHIFRECGRCHYTWTEATVDWQGGDNTADS